MAIIGTLPNNIANGQLADAVPVMADFNFIVNQVNANAQPLGTISPGALVNVQLFTVSATYNPTAGASKALVLAVGGGAGGGGAFNVNGGNPVAAGSGGGAGSWVLAYWTGITSQFITIGNAGPGNSGGNGSPGTNTTVGALIACPGGVGGIRGDGINAPIGNPPGPSNTPVLSGVTGLIVAQGMSGGNGSVFNFSIIGGAGGNSPFGAGANSLLNPAALANAFNFGAGGAGNTANFGVLNTSAGSAGNSGAVVILELK